MAYCKLCKGECMFPSYLGDIASGASPEIIKIYFSREMNLSSIVEHQRLLAEECKRKAEEASWQAKEFTALVNELVQKIEEQKRQERKNSPCTNCPNRFECPLVFTVKSKCIMRIHKSKTRKGLTIPDPQKEWTYNLLEFVYNRCNEGICEDQTEPYQIDTIVNIQ